MMLLGQIKLKELEPMSREKLKDILGIENLNTFNQVLTNLIKIGYLRRFENGIYFRPSHELTFKDLKPSLLDIIGLKYLSDDNGIRTGSFLLYKYFLTTQVSMYYEILTNQVSKHTRSKKIYENKVILSAPPFTINSSNKEILEILELIRLKILSDYPKKVFYEKIVELINQKQMDKKEIQRLSLYYQGKRHAGFRASVIEVLSGDFT